MPASKPVSRMASRRAAGIVALALAAMIGCGSEPPVVVDGSSTVLPISMAAQEGFDREHPGARIVVDSHGTGGGFGRYVQGEVDIVDASRPAKPKEEADSKAKGLDWTRFLVGHDGITVVVHPENDWVKSLSVEQLKAIFEPESRIKTWKQIDDSWDDRPIKFYTPDDDSGTFDFFTGAIVGEEGSQRKDVQSSANDNTLVEGVSRDRDALGYFGYAYYVENEDKLKSVPIDPGGDAGPMSPSTESIYDGSYTPLSRPLFIYVKDESARRPLVAEFVRYYLENVGTLAERAGYVAPTDAERSENSASLTKLLGGAASE